MENNLDSSFDSLVRDNDIRLRRTRTIDHIRDSFRASWRFWKVIAYWISRFPATKKIRYFLLDNRCIDIADHEAHSIVRHKDASVKFNQTVATGCVYGFRSWCYT